MMDSHVKMLPSRRGKVSPGTVSAGVNVNGENVYIGQYTPTFLERHTKLKSLLVYGVITPSQGTFTYCDYNSNDQKIVLKTSKNCLALTVGEDSITFHWMSSEVYSVKGSNYFPEGAVVTDQIGSCNERVLFFPARVDASVIKESKVVGDYDKRKFPADFDGPLFGLGQAWCDESVHVQGRQRSFNCYKVYVPYDGRIFKVNKFQFLFSCKLPPKLSHVTYPTVNWVTVSDGYLPPNAIAAGVAPNGEVLYVGRKEHINGYCIPGYIVPSENSLHVCYDNAEHCFSSDYLALTIEDQDDLEWVAYPNGHDVVDNMRRTFYVGRTLTGSDISTATTRGGVPINLPHERVANIQLLGKIRPSQRYLYVPWDGAEVMYPSYEMLTLKWRPKRLKHLCYNVIISSTMGMSSRIDRLPLPMHFRNVLKEISQYIVLVECNCSCMYTYTCSQVYR